MVPYVFTAIVWVIPVQLLFIKSDLSTILYKYALATSPSQLWFLVMLFDVFVIFGLLSNFFAKYDLLGMILAAGFFGLGVVGNMLAPNIFSVWTACRYVPLFWLGFKIRQHGTYWVRRIPVCAWIALDLLLFALAQYLGDTEQMLLKIAKLGVDFALHVVGAIMIFAVLQKLADKTNWTNSAAFSFLSKRSMVVYLLHQQVVYFMIHWLNGKVGILLNVAINFTAAMGISLLAATVLLKFKFTRFLVGERP